VRGLGGVLEAVEYDEPQKRDIALKFLMKQQNWDTMSYKDQVNPKNCIYIVKII